MFQHLTLKSSKKFLFYFILIFVLIIFSYFFSLFIHYECPIHKYLHLWCPGCGGTRMITSILQFDFYQAFRYNPLLFLFLIVGGIYGIILVFQAIKKKEILIPSYKIWIFILVIFLLYFILRNIPSFSYFIPTEV